MAGRALTICNTTPLINLASIGRVDLLESLFGKTAREGDENPYA
jgi:predicted nucleic acid-binding protein